MKKVDFGYRRNLGLLISSLVFITILFVVSVFFARSMIENFVYSDFNNKKIEVFDESLKPFNEFFNNKIPEVSYYQGYLDSAQAISYVNSVIRRYPFVEEIVFYDIIFSNNDTLNLGVKFNKLIIHPKGVYSYKLDNKNKLEVAKIVTGQGASEVDDFNNMALKVVSYLDKVNESSRLTDNEIYKVFYTINSAKIAYMNIPRMSDLIAYKDLMISESEFETNYDQDLFVFKLDPTRILINNTYPDLYENIKVSPIVEGRIDDTPAFLETELILPGALSDYKLQFETSEKYINREINRTFLPVVIGLSLLYLVLLLIVYLIFRNIAINGRLFRLQYDFINNLTHEFKTPVSVIKIAGNNIKSANKLSEEEKNLYGNILDQEADKLNNLMNKLLSFTQIENKSIKFKGELVDLKEFSEVFFASNKLKYPNMEITYSVQVDKPMLADPVLLSSVFQNMVDNAYKYSDPSRRYLEVNIGQNKRNFIITFRDKGIGINKAEFNNLFKKFYRVKNQFNQQGSIGLGLAFCKEITEFMGGEIKVESEVGVGSTFTLLFPLNVKII